MGDESATPPNTKRREYRSKWHAILENAIAAPCDRILLLT
jgi:hypothetical protein